MKLLPKKPVEKDIIDKYYESVAEAKYKIEMGRRLNNPDMIQLLPDIIHEYACECKGKHRLAVVFCPTSNYMRILKNEIFAKGGYKTLRNEFIYRSTHLLFIIPISPIIGIRPDTYFIFEEMAFPKQNKMMWEIIRRWI